MTSRVGQVFVFKQSLAVVTGEAAAPRKVGSSTPSASKQVDDLPVYTLLVLHDSGNHHWPVERWAASLDRWEAQGRLLTHTSSAV